MNTEKQNTNRNENISEHSNKLNEIEKKFSTGVIGATVWKNQGKNSNGEETEFQTISIERRYQDKDGNWKSTSSLRINDLPKVALVANKAYEYLVLKHE